MKLALEITEKEAREPEAHEVIQRAALKALEKAGGTAPPKGGEMDLIGALAQRATDRDAELRLQMTTDIAKYPRFRTSASYRGVRGKPPRRPLSAATTRRSSSRR